MDIRLKKKPFTVDLTLSADDRGAYLLVLNDARTTLASAMEWLRARGYVNLSQTAVHRHRRFVLASGEDDRLWMGVAASLVAVTEAGGQTVLAAGTVAKLEQVILRVLYTVREEVTLTPLDVSRLAAALAKTIASRTELDALQAKTAKRARLAARRAERAAKPKVTPREVAIRVREMLGLRIPPDPRRPQPQQLPGAAMVEGDGLSGPGKRT